MNLASFYLAENHFSNASKTYHHGVKPLCSSHYEIRLPITCLFCDSIYLTDISTPDEVSSCINHLQVNLSVLELFQTYVAQQYLISFCLMSIIMWLIIIMWFCAIHLAYSAIQIFNPTCSNFAGSRSSCASMSSHNFFIVMSLLNSFTKVV